MITKLSDIAAGVIQTNCANTTPVIVQQAPCADVCQIQATVPGTAIRLDRLNQDAGQIWDGLFSNRTPNVQFLALDAIDGHTGDYQTSGESPSAVDFPLFLNINEPAGVNPANAGRWQELVRFITVVPAIIGKIVTKSSNPNQQDLGIRVGTRQFNGDSCNVRELAPVCDTCFNNNNSSSFTATFNGPFAAGKNSFIQIDVATAVGGPGDTFFPPTRVQVYALGLALTDDFTEVGCGGNM